MELIESSGWTYSSVYFSKQSMKNFACESFKICIYLSEIWKFKAIRKKIDQKRNFIVVLKSTEDDSTRYLLFRIVRS